jgi:hypothetical protein
MSTRLASGAAPEAMHPGTVDAVSGCDELVGGARGDQAVMTVRDTKSGR